MPELVQTLIDALAMPLDAEDRPEAARTAQVLREMGPQQLGVAQPATPDHLAMRTLLAAP